MGFNLPNSVTAYLTKDNATTRALASLKSAVDPLLQIVGSCFEISPDGTLRIKRPLLLARLIATRIEVATLIASLPASFAGIVNVGPFSTLGNTTMKGTGVVQKKDDGTEGSFLVQNNLTVQGALSTSTGVKSCYDMGWAWASSATVGTRYRTSVFTQNQEANNTFKFVTLFQPPYAGSILGIQTWSQGSAGGTVNVQLFKNAVVTTGAPTVDVTTGGAGANVGATITYSKGTQAFAALDYYITSVSFNTAGNQAVNVRLYYELTA